jgi:hypothetical protein
MSFPVVTNVIDGHAYRVQAIGVCGLKALGVLSDEEEALLHRAVHLGLTGGEDPSLTWVDLLRALDVQRRIAARCVLGEDVARLPNRTLGRLAGAALSPDFLGA